jgi:hypothetical protein
MLDELIHELKHGARTLLKSPGFTAAAVLTLALCLGANLTIFAVVDSILLRPLPFPEPDRLVTMFKSYPKMGLMRADSSFPNYYFRRGKIEAFSHLAGIHETTAIVGDSGSTEVVEVARVTSEFFATLGVQPALGRAFTDEEMTYQTDHAVILTDSYWRQHFGGDPSVVGRAFVSAVGVCKRQAGNRNWKASL